MRQDMASTNLTLEMLPMDPPPGPPPDVPAPSDPEAPSEIEIVPLDATRTRPAPSPPEDKTDRFLREATHQYAEGHLDQPLWDRAFAQTNGDKEAAVAHYLQARAIALRLLDRQRHTEK